MFYVLVNYDTDWEFDLYRVEELRKLDQWLINEIIIEDFEDTSITKSIMQIIAKYRKDKENLIDKAFEDVVTDGDQE